jgi:hypothetical protein
MSAPIISINDESRSIFIILIPVEVLVLPLPKTLPAFFGWGGFG